jgi:hypothetical protein
VAHPFLPPPPSNKQVETKQNILGSSRTNSAAASKHGPSHAIKEREREREKERGRKKEENPRAHIREERIKRREGGGTHKRSRRTSREGSWKAETEHCS